MQSHSLIISSHAWSEKQRQRRHISSRARSRLTSLTLLVIEGANQKPPALIPSPFIPTGKMGETCNVVALGREDVCLEPKLLMSAYDKLLLDKALASTNDIVESGVAAPLVPLTKAVQALFPLVETGAYSALEKSLVAINAQITEIVAANPDLKPKLTSFKKSGLDPLRSAGKTGEASPTARVSTASSYLSRHPTGIP